MVNIAAAGRSFILRAQNKQNQTKGYPILPYFQNLSYFCGVVANSLALKQRPLHPQNQLKFWRQ
jgi:hypothetical protein